MLIRLSLIVAILAGLAAGALNFVTVKEKIVTLQTNLKTEIGLKETAQKDLANTKTTLAKTTTDLNQTKAKLDTTTKDLATVQKTADAQTKLAQSLTVDLGNVKKELQVTSDELAAYKALGYTTKEIIAMGKQTKDLQATIEALKEEDKLIGEKYENLQQQWDRMFHPERHVRMTALTGKVVVIDPKWNFVILNVGLDQGIKQDGELLVNRNGRLVAKVVVRSIQKNQCVANVLPGWQLGDIFEGDLVIPAYPES